MVLPFEKTPHLRGSVSPVNEDAVDMRSEWAGQSSLLHWQEKLVQALHEVL